MSRYSFKRPDARQPSNGYEMAHDYKDDVCVSDGKSSMNGTRGGAKQDSRGSHQGAQQFQAKSGTKMHILKQQLKRHQSGCVRPMDKYRGNLELETEQFHHGALCNKQDAGQDKKD